MEQEKSLIYDRFPPLCTNHPWLISQNFQDEDNDKDDNREKISHNSNNKKNKGEQVFYTVHDPSTYYRCRIPELLGNRIRACFHGWMILSKYPQRNNIVEWSLWNPITLKTIRLPPLVLKDNEVDYFDCCLPSSPDDPSSILLLTTHVKPNFVFCRLDRKRKKLKWIEMSYSKQLRNIAGHNSAPLVQPTCCNGKIYAWTCLEDDCGVTCVIQVDIVVKEKQVVITLLPFGSLPDIDFHVAFKGSDSDLFTVLVSTKYNIPDDARLYKLDMTTMEWTKINDLKGKVFYVDLHYNYAVDSSPAIASEFGGYIHIVAYLEKVIYSYNFKDKTILSCRMDCLDIRERGKRFISLWTTPEIRLQDDDEKAKFEANSKQDEMLVRSVTNDEIEYNRKLNKQARLFNIPFHLLEKIMEFCGGFEYLNFRATSKLCHLAAPVIRSNFQSVLERHSLGTPWLVVFKKDRGIITFTHPVFGDKYFIETPSELFYHKRILCSRFGWWLLLIDDTCLAFYNPFTSNIRKLPVSVPYFFYFCFSAPPTSTNCMVVGVSLDESNWHVVVHVVGEPSWRRFHIDFGGKRVFSYGFPTFVGQDVHVLLNAGGIQAFKGIQDDNLSSETIVEEIPRNMKEYKLWKQHEYLLVKCDGHHLLLLLRVFRSYVEVFKLNNSTKKWEEIDSLGRHVVYICGETSFCMDAKTRELENKIFFPKLHCGNGKIMFYCLETYMFHTFSDRKEEQNLYGFFGSKQHTDVHGWIESCWS